MKSYDFIKKHLLEKKDFNYLDSRFFFNIELYCKELNENYELLSEQDEINCLIKDLVISFSEKYGTTISAKQRQLIDDLDNGGRVVLFPYQPNIFPSVSVFAPAVHMEVIRKVMLKKYRKRIIPLFMFVDYDNCTDKRFLKAYVPNPGQNSSKRIISYTVDNEDSKDAIFATPLPQPETISRWKKEFQESIMHFSNIVKKYDETESEKINKNIQKLLSIIDNSYDSATSFASFNELFIEDILVNQWDCGILFVEGRELHNRSKKVLLKLENNKERINNLLIEAIDCFSQDGLTTSFPIHIDKKTLLWKYKFSCKMRCSKSSSCFELCKPDYLFPSVIADYLMDYINIHKIGGIGYYKQFEATCVSEYILKRAYNIGGVPQFLSSVSIDFISSYANEKGVPIASEFKRLKYDYDKYLKSTQDSHCSILFCASILGIQETYDFIENIV